jgi:alkylhydroperoxidase family enzyme
MKAKDKAWQLYSNYFDIVEGEAQEGQLGALHIKAINCALYCVDEALANAPDDIINDFDGTGEYYSVKAYYHHVKNEILKLNAQKKVTTA